MRRSWETSLMIPVLCPFQWHEQDPERSATARNVFVKETQKKKKKKNENLRSNQRFYLEEMLRPAKPFTRKITCTEKAPARGNVLFIHTCTVIYTHSHMEKHTWAAKTNRKNVFANRSQWEWCKHWENKTFLKAEDWTSPPVLWRIKRRFFFSCLSFGGKRTMTCEDEGRADEGEFMGDVCASAEQTVCKIRRTLY